jgi:signal transduction histidine kinase/CheY-like chemotaxis protein
MRLARMSFALMRWQDWPLGLKSAAAVTIPLALLISALVAGYRLQQNISEADAQVRRALAIQTDIQTLHTLIAEAAMAVRGYLLTGRDDFLTPYDNARQVLPQTIASLRRTVLDEDVQRRLTLIADLLDRKLLSLEKLRVEGVQQDAAELQTHLVSSKALLDELRAEIQGMYARETQLLTEYSANAREALLRSIWINAITSLLVLLSGVAAFLLLYTGVVRRVHHLALSAERLSCGEPLETLPTGRDELGLLAQRLQNASVLLASRAAEARSASLAKTRFLSRTSHELRTPLNAILGFAQLLASDLRQTAQASQVEQILVAGRHLLALIDEVLDIARIESGDLKLQLEPQALDSLSEEVTELLRPLAEGQSVSVERLPSLEGAVALGDRQRLRQVLINLVSNAIKYNRPGGRVQIGARCQDHLLWLTVEDTGAGIAPEQLPRLFSPFDRLDAEGSGIEGTGLGLAVSRQLVLRMGGDIEVDSRVGQGSLFSIRLARARRASDAAPSSQRPTEPASPPSVNRPRIALVIEDNESNLVLMRALLARRPQWTLNIARDGVAGLRAARAQPPSLILLDLHLPELSGQAVLAALRADPVLRDVPVVIVSADVLPTTLEELRRLGADDYLTKPIDVSRLLGLLDRYAAGARA